MVCELSTDPYVSQTSSLPLDAGEAAALGWIERQHDRLTEGAGFCAVDRTSGTPVGAVGLWTRGFPGGRVSAGYSLAPSARGRGVATDALAAVTDFAWSLPPIHRIELFIEPCNEGWPRGSNGPRTHDKAQHAQCSSASDAARCDWRCSGQVGPP